MSGRTDAAGSHAGQAEASLLPLMPRLAMALPGWRYRHHPLLSRLKRKFLALVTALVLLGPAAACAPTPGLSPAEPATLENSGYGFIRDGVSSRDELTTRIGQPVYEFENRRILVYRCHSSDNRVSLYSVGPVEPYNPRDMPSPHPELCSVVLVFDSNGILARHSLVISK
jgi:hypothetical protein